MLSRTVCQAMTGWARPSSAIKPAWVSIAPLSIEANVPDEKIVEDAYLSALSRLPTASERQKLVELLKETKPEERRAALEDLYWSLLSSREFLFNH